MTEKEKKKKPKKEEPVSLEQAGQRLEWPFVHLRWLWLAVALLVALTMPETEGDISLVVYIAVGFGFLYNLLVLALLWAEWCPSWMVYVSAVADAVVVMAVTGVITWINPESLVVLLAVIPIMTMSLRVGVEIGFLFAMATTFVYVILFVMGSEFGTELSTELLVKVGLNVLLVVSALFGSSILGGLYVGRFRRFVKAENEEEISGLRQEVEKANVVYEMATALSATLDYGRVLDTMLNLSAEALNSLKGKKDVSAIGMVLLIESDREPFTLRVHSGRNISRPDENSVISTEKGGIIAKCVYAAESVTTNNAQRDEGLTQFVSFQHVKSAIASPLRIGYDTYGLVVFGSQQENFYSHEHADMLSIFCRQAIVALQNAQLYQDLEAEQQRILAKESEARQKLARDLHDGPTQSISAMAMRINFVSMLLSKNADVEKAIEELAKLEELAQRTTHEIRTMLFTLRPVVLETQGLGAALQQYADRLAKVDNQNVEIDTDGYDGQLDTETEGVLFSIVEEAVNNAKKHAQADTIWVRLRVENEELYVEIEDNGVGFDVAKVKRSYDQRGSLGLINIEERARLAGGNSGMESTPGRGTRVWVRVPMYR